MRLPNFPSIPIVPTPRALALLTLLAPVAVVIAATAPSAWIIAPAAAFALLLVTLIDGWLAGELVSLNMQAASDCEVGQPVDLQIMADIVRDSAAAAPQASIGFDPRLGDGGMVEFSLTHTGTKNGFAGSGQAVPSRRGTGQLHDMWLRWAGPLGVVTVRACPSWLTAEP